MRRRRGKEEPPPPPPIPILLDEVDSGCTHGPSNAHWWDAHLMTPGREAWDSATI